MIKKSINNLLVAMSLLGSMLAPLAPITVSAQTVTDVCEGVALTGGDCGTDEQTQSEISDIVQTVVNILSVIVGVVAVIMIIIAGLKYITSSGDSNNVTSAKNTILYAIIGLIVVALAQVIVRFVLNAVD